MKRDCGSRTRLPSTHDERRFTGPRWMLGCRSWGCQFASNRRGISGGDLDESPTAYRRLPKVLAHHSGTVKVLHTLRPFAVAMAGAGEFDPFKLYVRVTAERVREENSSEGEDMASITRRSRDIQELMLIPNISRSVADRSCQESLEWAAPAPGSSSAISGSSNRAVGVPRTAPNFF